LPEPVAGAGRMPSQGQEALQGKIVFSFAFSKLIIMSSLTANLGIILSKMPKEAVKETKRGFFLRQNV
jgi:hypothetical protein